MAHIRRKLTWDDVMFLTTLEDPATHYEFFHKDERTKDGRNYLAVETFCFYMYGMLLNNYVTKCSGRDTTKSSSNETLLSIWAMFRPKRKTALVVPAEKHMIEFFNNLTTYFTTNDFLKLFYGNSDQRNHKLWFKNSHYLEARIVGTDYEGKRSLIALHFDGLLIDEAQEVNSIALTQLFPGGKADCDCVIAGVPDDVRTSILWWGWDSPQFLNFGFASYQGPNWTEEKKALLLETYGMQPGDETDPSKWPAGWRTQVEGVWGDPVKSVFAPSSIGKARIKIEEYGFQNVSYREGIVTDSIISPSNKMPMASSYYIAADIGPGQAPTLITVWANVDKGNSIFSHCVYRLKLQRFPAPEAAKILFNLHNWYQSSGIGIDVHGYGQAVMEILKKLFEEHNLATYVLVPVDFSERVIIGYNKEKDEQGKELVREVISTVKVHSTTLLQRYFTEEYIKIPDTDTQFMETLLAETANISRQRIGGYTYQNLKDPHTIDSMRCMAIIRFKQKERPSAPGNIKHKFVLPVVRNIRK
jgi:hypothetical protein